MPIGELSVYANMCVSIAKAHRSTLKNILHTTPQESKVAMSVVRTSPSPPQTYIHTPPFSSQPKTNTNKINGIKKRKTKPRNSQMKEILRKKSRK